jgi:hypothetical protein
MFLGTFVTDGCECPVEDEDFSEVTDGDVVWMEGAVVDSVAVCVGDGVADAEEDVEEVVEIRGVLLCGIGEAGDEGCEGAALEELGGVVEAAEFVGAGVVDWWDAWMLEEAADACLAKEPLRGDWILLAFRAEAFEGDLSAEEGVVSFEDNGGAAFDDRGANEVGARLVGHRNGFEGSGERALGAWRWD